MAYLVKTKKRIYYKNIVVLEKDTASTETFTPEKDVLAEFTLVGAGAGGAFNSSSNRSSAAAGGSGSGCTIQANIKGGVTYTVEVGTGGVVNGGRDATATGGRGGSTIIKVGDEALVTAEGGIGGNVWWPNGSSAGAPAPLPTVNTSDVNIEFQKWIFREQGIPGAIGGNPSAGGPSVFEGTTYGQGGNAYNAGGGSWGEVGNSGYIKVVYKEVVQEGEEYDDYEEVVKLYLAKVKKRTYCKNKPWTQPVLTENGTLGGEGFAILSSKGAANDYAIFNAGAEGTATIDTYPNAAPQWVSFYNPEPLKVSKIQLGQNKSNELNNYYIQAYEIQASDDNVTWKSVFSASGLTPQQILTAEIPDSGYHKYYRVYVSAAKYYSGYPRVFFTGITINEAYTREEATADDYDYFIEEVRQYAARRKTRKYYKYGEFTKVGSPTVVNGIASGFSQYDNLIIPTLFNPGSSNWEVVLKFRKTSSATTQALFTSVSSSDKGGEAYGTISAYGMQLHMESNKLSFYLSSNGSSWNVAAKVTGATVLENFKNYYVKIIYNGINYRILLSTTGKFTGEEKTEITVNSNFNVLPRYYMLGANGTTAANWFLTGSIDLTQSYIKIGNSIWWQGATEVSATDDWDYYIDEEL